MLFAASFRDYSKCAIRGPLEPLFSALDSLEQKGNIEAVSQARETPMQRVMARLEEAFEYSALWYLEKAEGGPKLTTEQERNVDTFHALRKSVKDMQPALKQAVAELEEWHSKGFERTLLNLLGRVSDRFRPATAADFVTALFDEIGMLRAA
ncbi:MAG TPA: hypothetical protein VH206_06535 [Xanthobacteraceae bacterium]|nr:hypothetical protein [Xanthobacteraceae bacterium]